MDEQKSATLYKLVGQQTAASFRYSPAPLVNAHVHNETELKFYIPCCCCIVVGVSIAEIPATVVFDHVMTNIKPVCSEKSSERRTKTKIRGSWAHISFKVVRVEHTKKQSNEIILTKTMTIK